MEITDKVKKEEKRLRDLIEWHEKCIAKYQEELREHINRHDLNKKGK